MENLFLKYMKERSLKSTKTTIDKKRTFHEPVITISREYGCPGESIAERLAGILTKKNEINGGHDHWKWMSKEIIEESAKKLKLTPALTDELSGKKGRGFFENLALFFSDEFYPSDGAVQGSIAEFIHDSAAQGHVVILGRASEIITHNFPNSLHVRLFAPLQFRTETISINHGISISSAKKMCIENDMRRESFRKYFRGEKEEMGFYDVIINTKELTEDEIVEMVLILAEARGFV